MADVPSEEVTLVPEKTPWYESTLLWGALGAFIAIVLTVVAATMKDLRWLLLVAWPFSCVAAWAMFKGFRTGWVFASICSLLVAGGLWSLNIKLKPKPAVTTTNSGPNTTDSPNSVDSWAFHENLETITFSLGGMSDIEPADGARHQPFNFGGVLPVSYRYSTEDHEVHFDVTVWGGAGNAPFIEVKDHDFTMRSIPHNWDRNHADNALEVVNGDRVPILQIVRKTPGTFQVNGIFPTPSGLLLAAGDHTEMVSNPMDRVPTSYDLKPLFKYPSWKYPGQFAEDAPLANTKGAPVTPMTDAIVLTSEVHPFVHGYEIGRPLNFNLYLANESTVVAERVGGTGKIFLPSLLEFAAHPDEIEEQYFQEFLREFNKAPTKLGGDETSPLGPQDRTRFFSPVGPVLTDELDRKISDGTLRILIVGVVLFSDKYGDHEREFCEYLQHPWQQLTTHGCGVHNRLVR